MIYLQKWKNKEEILLLSFYCSRIYSTVGVIICGVYYPMEQNHLREQKSAHCLQHAILQTLRIYNAVNIILIVSTVALYTIYIYSS